MNHLTNQESIAICMATYNGEGYLREQLDSILGQTVPDWVLFIRDDGSRDGTFSILEQYAQQDSRIHLIQEPGLPGGSAQKNFSAILNIIIKDTVKIRNTAIQNANFHRRYLI